MVNFRRIVTASLLLAPTMAAISVGQIVNDINTLTGQVNNLIPVASTINSLNAFLVLFGQGPVAQVTKGLGDVTNTLTKITKGILSGISIPLEDDAKAISIALQNFVNAQAKVLQVVVQKAGALNPILLLEPALVTALNSVNSAVGQLVSGLSTVVPQQTNALTSLTTALGSTVQNTVGALLDIVKITPKTKREQMEVIQAIQAIQALKARAEIEV